MNNVFIGILVVVFGYCPLLAIAQQSQTKAQTLTRDEQSSIIFYLDQATSGKHSKVLLLVLQGSDCNSVAHIKSVHDVFRNVWPQADLLTIEKHGIDASLPYTKSPARPDCPKPYIQSDSPERRAEDAIQVLKSVQHEYQYDSVVLLGGSEGALVAYLIAARVNFIDASIVFNGGGRWFLDDVLHNVRSTSGSIEEAEESTAGLKGFAKQILTAAPFDIEMSGHGYAWWRSALEVDQLALLKKTNSPILLIQSGRDQSVSPLLVDKMVSELTEAGNKNITYMKYSALDHGLNDENGVNQMSRVLEDMQKWLATEIK